MSNSTLYFFFLLCILYFYVFFIHLKAFLFGVERILEKEIKPIKKHSLEISDQGGDLSSADRLGDWVSCLFIVLSRLLLFAYFARSFISS